MKAEKGQKYQTAKKVKDVPVSRSRKQQGVSPTRTGYRAKQAERFAGKELLVGRKALLEVFRYQTERVSKVILRQGVELEQSLKEQISQYRTRGGEVAVLEPLEFAEATAESVASQGVAALLEQRQLARLDRLIENALADERGGVLLAVDQVVDPQNLGAILRVAEAFAVGGVILTRRHTAPLNEVVRKSSMGASELLDVCEVNNLHQVLLELKKKGFWIAGSALDERARGLEEASIPFPVVLIVGSEGEGIRRVCLEDCDILLKIEMPGRMQSLNVSQATSILLYELRRKK